MKILIEGNEVNNEDIAVYSLSYGKQGISNLKNFKIEIESEIFINMFDNEYKKFIKECKADDEATGDPDPEYLAKLNYPSLRNLLEYSDYFEHLVIHLIYFEVLSVLFSDSERSRYVVNVLDKVSLREGVIIFIGKVRDKLIDG